MAEHSKGSERLDVQGLYELVGPLHNKKDLFPALRDHPGLIAVHAADGYEYCPVDQFILEDEYYALRPALSDVWTTIRVHDSQLGDSPLSTYMRLKAPRLSFRGKSCLDILVSETLTQEDIDLVKKEMFLDVIERANQLSLELTSRESTSGNNPV